jgi:hypothetical protein
MPASFLVNQIPAMNNDPHDHGKLVRYGNPFPWAGILAGVKRMLFYTFLVVCLLVALGIVGLVIIGLFVDNEPVVDRF